MIDRFLERVRLGLPSGATRSKVSAYRWHAQVGSADENAFLGLTVKAWYQATMFHTTAEIRDFFAHGQIAFHVEARIRLAAVQLPAEHRNARSELICIRMRPPSRTLAPSITAPKVEGL